MVQDDKSCVRISLPQNTKTLAQWQVDSAAIDDENGSRVRRRPVRDQVLESDGMKSRALPECFKQIMGREAILVDNVDGE